MPTPRHRRRRPRSLGGPLALGAIFLLAGLLFAASAQLGGRLGAREPDSLRGLVAAEKTRQDERTDEVAALTTERDALLAAQPRASLGPTIPAGARLAAGTDPVTGAGISVTLDDAPSGGVKPPGTRPDDLVVHQSDIEGVVNALWRGGAEAMAIQGKRLTETTAIRCVGNVLLLEGQVYSPPYRIEAIGPSDQMRAALDASPAVQLYLDWVQTVGLGWSVQTLGALSLPAFDGAATGLRYATPTAGH